MIKTVLDTNIYISAILFGGIPKKIMESILRGDIKAFVSAEILDELKSVLESKKFGFPPSITQQIIIEIDAMTEYVIPEKKHNVVSRDSSDNVIIDCAVEAEAAYIISGDKDLLSIGEFKDIKIVSPTEFMKLIEKDGR